MTATTQERPTPARDNVDFVFPVAAAKKILAGTIVVLDSSGNAEPGATATGKIAVGIAQETVDNGSGSAGDLAVRVRRGTYLLANSATTDEITNADYGSTCYVVDNQTVGKTSGTNTRSAAGTVRGVTSAGVWVEF
jgi:hypothetical protein